MRSHQDYFDQPDWRLDTRPNAQLQDWFDSASPEQQAEHIGEVAFGPWERRLWQLFFDRSRARMALVSLLRQDSRKFWVGPAHLPTTACEREGAFCMVSRARNCQEPQRPC